MTTKEEFAAVYPGLAEELIAEAETEFEMPPHAIAWLRELLGTSVCGGKMTRGITVVQGLKTIKGELSDEEKRKASILGWCIELLQAYFLVADDVMDASKVRRGKPCWYLQPRPIQGATEQDKYFRTESYYVDLLDLFNEVTYQTELGQLLDLTSQPSDYTTDLSLFTLDNYRKIVKYKTAFYSFYLPVALALTIGGKASEEALAVAKPILLEMGEYFQIQDDYLDCYADPAVLGKVGRDIEEKKCGWLVVQALQRCTAEQKAVIEKHYGTEDPEDVAIIKALYRELGLEKVFQEFEENSYKSLTSQIGAVDEAVLHPEILQMLLQKIYKRKL